MALNNASLKNINETKDKNTLNLIQELNKTHIIKC